MAPYPRIFWSCNLVLHVANGLHSVRALARLVPLISCPWGYWKWTRTGAFSADLESWTQCRALKYSVKLHKYFSGSRLYSYISFICFPGTLSRKRRDSSYLRQTSWDYVGHAKYLSSNTLTFCSTRLFSFTWGIGHLITHVHSTSGAFIMLLHATAPLPRDDTS